MTEPQHLDPEDSRDRFAPRPDGGEEAAEGQNRGADTRTTRWTPAQSDSPVSPPHSAFQPTRANQSPQSNGVVGGGAAEGSAADSSLRSWPGARRIPAAAGPGTHTTQATPSSAGAPGASDVPVTQTRQAAYTGQTAYTGQGTQPRQTATAAFAAPRSASASGGSGSGGGPSFPQSSGAPSPRRRTPRGPGWGGTIVGMVLTGLVTLAIVFGVWGAQSPFSTSANMTGTDSQTGAGNTFAQSGAEVVEPVETVDGVANWEAVAAAVRPATVSIFVSGESESASGSGVIIDSAGHIITNQHVVSGFSDGGSITVTLHDGRVYSATIVGGDTTTDLAVIVLDTPPDDLTAALLGDSSNLAVGEAVMAIGAPLGLADTVTTGIISALDRPVAVSGGASDQDDVVVTNAIQVDASINPGNSGGPLFNASGAVIGINSSIASLASGADGAGSIGLGFAIPVNLVKSIAAQIIETGSAQHAMLGVQIGTGVVVIGEESRLGAVVAAVTPGGAASGAGILEGDVIVGIDGNSVVSGPALTGYVRRYMAGDQVILDVARDGQVTQIPVTLQQK